MAIIFKKEPRKTKVKHILCTKSGVIGLFLIVILVKSFGDYYMSSFTSRLALSEEEREEKFMFDVMRDIKNSHTSSTGTVNKRTWNAWPAVAYEEIDHPLVFKGESFVSKMREILFTSSSWASPSTLMDEFLEVYKNRPDKINKCGILINHALALFVAVKQLKPSLVVESGVNAGQSTYFIRKASPSTKIWAIDPYEKPICDQPNRWVDHNNKTTYFVGDKFMDLMKYDWVNLVANGEVDANRTLFFIDDHKLAIQRIKYLATAGMKHIIIEDNYKLGEGASYLDQLGYTPKQAFIHPERKKDAKWLFENIISYAEFPPLIPPIMAKKAPFERKKAGGFMVWQDKNEDIVAPILRPDLYSGDDKRFREIAARLELDPEIIDFESYKQFMNYNQICYLELL